VGDDPARQLSELVKFRRRRGVPQLQLDEMETALLGSLLDDLLDALGTLPENDPVRQRLFPDGYRDDEEAAAEFRELTETGLRDDKAARAERCRAELPAGSGELSLPPDAAERWLTVLNDLRLALGTRLGVTEDEPADIDPADPRAQSWVVYYWLTTLQDGLVQTAMR
jgi:uncharacterized protein DUF2017